MVHHLGALFPVNEEENAAIPAPIAARMFLRHMRVRDKPDWGEVLQLLGLETMLSQKKHLFRKPAYAAAINPPTELVTEVRQ